MIPFDRWILYISSQTPNAACPLFLRKNYCSYVRAQYPVIPTVSSFNDTLSILMIPYAPGPSEEEAWRENTRKWCNSYKKKKRKKSRIQTISPLYPPASTWLMMMMLTSAPSFFHCNLVHTYNTARQKEKEKNNNKTRWEQRVVILQGV